MTMTQGVLLGFAIIAWCSVPYLRAILGVMRLIQDLTARGRLDMMTEIFGDNLFGSFEFQQLRTKFEYQLYVQETGKEPDDIEEFVGDLINTDSLRALAFSPASLVRAAWRSLFWPLYSYDREDRALTLAIEDTISREVYGMPTCLCPAPDCDGWMCLPDSVIEAIETMPFPEGVTE